MSNAFGLFTGTPGLAGVTLKTSSATPTLSTSTVDVYYYESDAGESDVKNNLTLGSYTIPTGTLFTKATIAKTSVTVTNYATVEIAGRVDISIGFGPSSEETTYVSTSSNGTVTCPTKTVYYYSTPKTVSVYLYGRCVHTSNTLRYPQNVSATIKNASGNTVTVKYMTASL